MSLGTGLPGVAAVVDAGGRREGGAVEQRTTSIEAVAATLRPDIEVQGAVRWVRRPLVVVAIALKVLKGLRPDVFGGVAPTRGELRAAMNVAEVLPAYRHRRERDPLPPESPGTRDHPLPRY